MCIITMNYSKLRTDLKKNLTRAIKGTEEKLNVNETQSRCTKTNNIIIN